MIHALLKPKKKAEFIEALKRTVHKPDGAKEVVTEKTRVSSGGVGCTAAFSPTGGGSAPLFALTLVALALLVGRRRSHQNP